MSHQDKPKQKQVGQKDTHWPLSQRGKYRNGTGPVVCIFLYKLPACCFQSTRCSRFLTNFTFNRWVRGGQHFLQNVFTSSRSELFQLSGQCRVSNYRVRSVRALLVWLDLGWFNGFAPERLVNLCFSSQNLWQSVDIKNVFPFVEPPLTFCKTFTNSSSKLKHQPKLKQQGKDKILNWVKTPWTSTLHDN